MNSALFLFRLFHNWAQEEIAQKLSIPVAEYTALESGLDKADTALALKLSEIYQAPSHFFLSPDPSGHHSVIYSNCRFENSNGYVNHLYSDEKLADVQAKEIEDLKKEIRRLQQANEQLLQALLQKI